jgi:hypothetical protein
MKIHNEIISHNLFGESDKDAEKLLVYLALRFKLWTSRIESRTADNSIAEKTTTSYPLVSSLNELTSDLMYLIIPHNVMFLFPPACTLTLININ